MEIIDLKAFVAVVEQGTTTRAAQFLGMTQPGVSKHIARLENDLGFQIFRRSGRSLVLNDLGETILERIKKILSEIDGLKGFVYGTCCPIGTLKIGLTDSSTMLIIPQAITKFHKNFPGIHISLDVESSNLIQERVLNGDYDFGIVTASLKPHPLLEEDVLYHDNMDALISFSHPFSGKKSLTLSDLASQPLIISPKRRRTREIIDSVFSSKNLAPKDIIDVYNNMAAVRLADAGLGVALLPRAFIVKQKPSHKCKHVKIDGDPFKRILSIVRKNNEVQSEATRLFYDIVMGRSGKLWTAF